MNDSNRYRGTEEKDTNSVLRHGKKSLAVHFHLQNLGGRLSLTFVTWHGLIWMKWRSLREAQIQLVNSAEVLLVVARLFVASNPRDLWFESSNRQFLFIINYVKNCVEKTKVKKKRTRMVHLKTHSMIVYYIRSIQLTGKSPRVSSRNVRL